MEIEHLGANRLAALSHVADIGPELSKRHRRGRRHRAEGLERVGQTDRRRALRFGLHRVIGTELPLNALVELQPVRSPDRLRRIDALDQSKIRVPLNEGDAADLTQSAIEAVDTDELGVGPTVPVQLGSAPGGRGLADLHPVDLLALGIQRGRRRLLEDECPDAHRPGQDENGQADSMEAQARRFQRRQLPIPLELHEEKDRCHEHDDGQGLVQCRREAIREVLEDGAQRWFVAAQRLDEIDHDKDRRGHAQSVAEVDDELPGEIAVDERAQIATPPNVPRARARGRAAAERRQRRSGRKEVEDAGCETPPPPRRRLDREVQEDAADQSEHDDGHPAPSAPGTKHRHAAEGLLGDVMHQVNDDAAHRRDGSPPPMKPDAQGKGDHREHDRSQRQG